MADSPDIDGAGPPAAARRAPPLDFGAETPWWDVYVLLAALSFWMLGESWKFEKVEEIGTGLMLAYLVGATLGRLRADLREGLTAWMKLNYKMVLVGVFGLVVVGWVAR